ncbi:hypothetical protein LPJ61_004327 [Coemansia biformis]|uniref:Uncharacterized protein n=1 Tax=Coemansia biformis TaxID=1286918 RepID=A0A9W7Y513_9FUNG|nr:hypothetical protein LPJ61_004327 [Coemansia biformis]
MSAAISHVKPAQSCKAEEEVNTKAVEESAMFKGMRAHWTADNDCQFVTTLARHTVCNERQGLILNHKYIDQVVVKDIATGLDNNVSIDDLVHELAQKYPTKKEEHRSHECIELITELRKKLPQFGYEQLNHKHINMWTRTIVPFRQLFDAGTLFRGKPMVHKDCKRFTKAIMDFLANIITNGVTNIDTNMFLKKDDKSGKLLEQWLTAMLVVHGQAMVRFLYVCSVKLAVSFIDSKRVGERTPEDAWFLEAANHTPQQVELVLKEYMTHIIRNEALDSISDKVLVSEIIAMRNREAAQLAGRKNPQMHMADRAAFPPHLSQQQQPPRAPPERRGYSPSERYDYPPLEHRDYMPSDDYRHPPTESYGYPPSEHYGRPDMHGADPRYYGHTSPHFQPPRQASRVAGYMPRSAHPPPSLPVHQNHHAQPGPRPG